MKIKIIDLLFFVHEQRLEEGFKFIFRDEVLEYKNKKLMIAKTGNSLGYKYNLENVLDEEIIVLTPDLINIDEDSTTTQVNDSVKKRRYR